MLSKSFLNQQIVQWKGATGSEQWRKESTSCGEPKLIKILLEVCVVVASEGLPGSYNEGHVKGAGQGLPDTSGDWGANA